MIAFEMVLILLSYLLIWYTLYEILEKIHELYLLDLFHSIYAYLLNLSLMKNTLTYPCWDKWITVPTPIDELSDEYKQNQIRYHKQRIADSEYYISLLS